MEECKVWEIKTLGREKDAEVKKLLQTVALQLQPIMRRRRWRVRLLSEFSPRNASLLGLNVNRGSEIKIRVRRHGRDTDFYDFEFVLGTMLHELTHIECGQHDGKFYKLLDELTKECEELMAKGVTGTGQGFDAPGQRLSKTSHNPPSSALRKTAVAAAEKRRNLGQLMPAGPQRVGGDIYVSKALSPAQAAAMAAERRLKDDIWCAAPDTADDDGFQKAKYREDEEQAEAESSNDHVDKRPKLDPVSEWECSICTLLNPPLAPICAACESPKPSDANMWHCKFCRGQNPKLLERCSLCDQWRHS